MPHAFDTLMTQPQRTVLRRGLVARLEALKQPTLYAKTVKGFHTRVKGDEEVKQLAEQASGQTPAIFVYLGKKDTEVQAVRGDHDRNLGELDVYVYFVCDNLRGKLSRVEADIVADGDVTADPGLDTMLEHASMLLLGYKVPEENGSKTIDVLLFESEDEVGDYQELTVWEQKYSVRVQVDPDRAKGITQLIEEVQTTHHQDGSPDANDVVATTEIGP